jgi:hypothetical protein
MKRRYLILALGFVAFVGIVLGVLAILPPRTGITKANFDRIEKRMTVEDCEALLGDGWWRLSDTFSERNTPGFFTMVWRKDDGACIRVDFDDYIVTTTSWTDSTLTILDRIRRWLQLD